MCVSVVLATVGWGMYAVLSDNGFVAKVEDYLPDTKVGKVLSYIQKNF